MNNQKIGVLVMAYGGPNCLEEIPGYLADIRSGRPTTPAVLEEITNNYWLIGGKSPLLELTRQQMEAIAAHRAPSGETVLTLMSDDNFNPFQRSLILQFTLPETAPVVAGPRG